jgi:hypothetical protein
MDPLTALGLAANILQSVSVGRKLVSFAQEVRRSADGHPVELKQLKSVIADIRRKIESQALPGPTSVSDDDDNSIGTVAHECLELAETLITILAEFQAKRTGLARRWLESYLIAGKYLPKKEEISRLKNRLFELERRFSGWWKAEQSL